MRLAFVYLAVMLLIASAGWVYAVDTAVSACSTLGSAGIYNVTVNLFASGADCIDITVSDVTLNCQGFTISGNSAGSTNGIQISNANNVSVHGCRIMNFSTGVDVVASSNVTIRNNTLTNMTQWGLVTEKGSGTNTNTTHVYNNTISYNPLSGIYFTNTRNSEVYNNLMYNNSGPAIAADLGTNNNFTNNTIWNNTRAISVSNNENYTYVFNNTLYNQTDNAVVTAGAVGAVIHQNWIYNNTGYGVLLQSGTNNNVTQNTLHNNTNYAIRADNRENNSYIFNNTVNFSVGAVILAGTTGSRVQGNTFYNLTNLVVHFQGGTWNNATSNTITNATQPAIRFDSNENFSKADSNTISYTNGGVWLVTATNDTARDNTISFVTTNAVLIQDGGINHTVFNNTIYNFTQTGIQLQDASNTSYILNNSLYNSSYGGISVGSRSSSNFVQYNNVSFIYGATGMGLDDTQSNMVSDNRLINVSGQSFQISTASRFNTFYKNVIANFSSSATIEFSGQSNNNTVWMNNFTDGYSQAISVLNGSYNNVSYNRVENVTSNAIQVQQASTFTTVADNVILNNTDGGVYGVFVSNSSFNTLIRNVINQSKGGIQLTTLANNNTVQDNSIYFTTGYGILLQSSSENNTLFRNFIANNSFDGIRIATSSSNNYVLNNTLTNGTYDQAIGIHLLGQSNLNFIHYNNLSFIYSTGVQVLNSSNNSIRYNRIFNTTYSPFYVGVLSTYNSIISNTIENTSYRGLVLSNSSYNTIQSNTFRFFEAIEVATGANNNTFDSNTFFTSNTNTLVQSASSNNAYRYNNFSYCGCNYALNLGVGSDYTYFTENVIQGNSETGAYVHDASNVFFNGDRFLNNAAATGNQSRVQDGATNIQFNNVTFSGSQFFSQGYHVSVMNRSAVILLNATFNRSLVDIGSSDSNVTYRWYVRVNVSDLDGDGVSSSAVSILNTTNMNESAVNVSQTSGSDGLTPYVALTEAFITRALTNNVSSYNFTAGRLGLYSNSSLFNVTQSGTVTVQVNVPPVVVLSSPLDGLFNRSRTIIFRYVPTDADDVTFLNCSVWTNETAWSIKASNASSITNGSNNSISVTFSADGFYRWNVGCFDRSAEGAFSTANFTIRIDNTTPSGLSLRSSANNSYSTYNYSFVNFTFLDLNPNNCILEFGNATQVANYSMTKFANSTGGYCSFNVTGNFTVAANQTHNYTVWINDSAGNINSSGLYFVTHDSVSPSGLSLRSSANNSYSTYNYSFVNFTFL
ncbi:right-handed parallel beta-helix repeat-containing protein, partial [Candidatus Micrarchaeota archaeon]|nr:right-handed parallel beta-helix repeat-containing protein [Candidatus Micrarchaeota archaeon]